MRLSGIGELSLLEAIKRRFPGKGGALRVGIGDDAAVISPRGNLALTTDMMVEGVHFDLSYITPFQLGFKLVSVNVSDIYAMGGSPSYALLGLALRPETEESFLDALLDGVGEALRFYKAELVGGDLSSAPVAVLSATLIGHVSRPVKRGGARPGDFIYVTGPLGDSAMGLELLKRIGRPVDLKKPVNKPFKWALLRPLLERHLQPVARDPKGFKRHATAMIDISDGLSIDLVRLCTEGRVGARIYEEKIPVSLEVKTLAGYLGLDPLPLALKGGEDYELLFTSPHRIRNAICIGEVAKSGLMLVDRRGRHRPVRPEGYKHFEV